MKNLLLLGLIVIFSILIGQSVVSLGALFLTDFNSSEALDLLAFPQNYPSYRLFFLFSQGFSNLFVLGLPPLVTLLFIQKQKLSSVFLNSETLPQTLLLGVILLLVAFPLIDFASALNADIPLPAGLETYLKGLNDSLEEIYDYTSNMGSLDDFVLTCFVIAVIPALAEELLFRGLVQTNLAKSLNIHVAIGLTSLIFAVVHVQFYYILPRFLISLLLGYAFYYTSNLLIPMVMHFMFNASVLSLLYFWEVAILEGEYATYDNPILKGLLLAVVAGLVFVLLRTLKRLGSKIERVSGVE